MPLSTQPASILVIRSGAVGDFVLTTPVIASLRSAYPCARLEICGNPDSVALISDLIEDTLDINAAAWAPFFVRNSAPVGDLARQISSTDLIVNFLPDPDNVFSENLRSLTEGTVLSHSPHPLEDGSIHIVDHLLSAIRPLDIETTTQPIVSFEDSIGLPDDITTPYAVMHPGSGGMNKIWPLERFAEVSQKLVEGLHVVVSVGPADEHITSEIKHLLPDIQIVASQTLPQLANLLKGASLYIGNDSGPTHIAAATGTTTVAIFGPTDPRIWKPRGRNVSVLEASQITPKAKRLDSITTAQVVEKVALLLQGDP
jgi:ADP-heptose:LPS heptosyltransferase